MERSQVHIKPTSVTGLSDSANRLGVTLAEQQLDVVQGSYRERYTAGIQKFYQDQTLGSEVLGQELAQLKLEARRRMLIDVGRVVGLMGLPCCVVGWLFFGTATGVGLLAGSFVVGILIYLR